MLLQGSIQRFNLAGVLQYLAQNAASGVLAIHDFEEYGFVYLINGRVEDISLPITDEKLGQRLIGAGCLSEQQLAQVLMEDADSATDHKRKTPLGQRLIEKGLVSEDTIRQVMKQQTLDQVFELAHWENGVFAYEEPEEMPQFRVAIEGNVQELLLDAQRRIDEGKQARKNPSGIENEVCYQCPLTSECSSAIRIKYLKSETCLWRGLGAVLDDDHQRLRDARQLYRSKEEDATQALEASLTNSGLPADGSRSH